MIKFGTDGWRAIISDEFTFENVKKVAVSIAKYLIDSKKSNKPLIIGYDPRFLADKFAFEVAKVMTGAGIDVLLPNRDIPTPVVAWSIKDKKACGAVMITASHNPPQYCGIKFIPDYAGPAHEGITKELQENSNKETFLPKPDRKGKIDHFEPKEKYFNCLSSLIDFSVIKKAKLKLVYDPMYGSGRAYTDFILSKSGCNVESIHNYRDVLFGGQNPEPSDEFLSELKNKVIETGSVLGLATDGDADRFGIVDEKGVFYSANQVITMLFEYLVEDRRIKGAVVRSIGTTSMIDEIAKRHNIKVYETPVGFKYISEYMMNEAVVIGGEESGGLSIKGHIPEKDGILADLLVVEMVARRGKKLSDIWNELTQKVGVFYSLRLKLDITPDKKQKLMSYLKENPVSEIANIEVVQIKTIDGVKVILKDGSWFLTRPSGTEPLIRVYGESKNNVVLDGIKRYFNDIVYS